MGEFGICGTGRGQLNNPYQGFFQDFSQGGSKRGITGYRGDNVV